MNKSFLTLSLAFASAIGFSQTLDQVLIKTDNERFADAASDFLVLIKKEPAKGEYYFYSGENYFKRGDIDSANIYYSKGVEVNATNPLNYVGLGKVLLAKNNVAEAKTQFFKAASVGQNKNAEVMRRTSEAWLATSNKNADEAINQANLAIKLEPKNAENYILLGDAQLEKTPADGGPAIKSYKIATSLNPKSPKGILREGQLYQRGRNYQLALDKYKEAEAIDATYAPAYREKAELFYLVNQLNKSIENWKKYLELNNSNDARYMFLNALFRNKQYNDVVNEGETLRKNGFSNYTIERLMGYAYYEMGNKTDTAAFTKGFKSINKFFELTTPIANFKYLPTDYKYKGLLLSKTGKDSLGIIEMEKAVALDPTYAKDAYSDIAGIYYKNKRYAKVSSYIEKKQTIDATSLNNTDYFNLGRAYYNTALPLFNEAMNSKDAKVKTAKETEALPYLIKADTAFAGLVRKNPSWVTAYIWRGRTNSLTEILLKKEKEGMAKVHYEKVLSMVKPEEKTTTYKKETIEALEYLGSYYVSINDKAKADEIFNQLKEIDPNNPKVKNYFTPQKSGGTVKPGTK
jgi:tetratricopeptide (TPR) repeat protein